MTTQERNHHYKVSWKKVHSKAPTVVMDYLAPNLKGLLAILDRSEGVTPVSTEFLIVHCIDHKTGVAAEVMAHESRTGLTVTNYSQDAMARQDNVISQVEKILEQTRKQDKPTSNVTPNKPRIRLKTDSKKYVIGGFFYMALEASQE